MYDKARRVEGSHGRCTSCNDALGECDVSSSSIICHSHGMQVLEQGKGTDCFGKADHLGVHLLATHFDIETDGKLSRYLLLRLLAVSRPPLSCAN